MERANKFIPKILFAEGGSKYTNDPNDSGGETKYGISKKAFPNLDIKNLTEVQAIAIYKKLYCDPCKIDLIKDEFLALHVFDFAVTSGVHRAIEVLQSVIGVLTDGIFGNQTLQKVNSGNYLNAYKNARIAFYTNIGIGKNAKFKKGWINRVNNLKL
jgi:lysozyme family protein